MYKVASDNRQRVLHHGRPQDWVNGDERLSVEDKLALAISGIKALDDRIQRTPDRAEKKKLGLMKLQMQGEMGALRKLCGKVRVAKEGFDQVFISQAKEMLLPAQFRAILASTNREIARRKEELINLEGEVR